jgi:short-subunit dehydrogenase
LQIAGSHVLVTGASSGIGAALARQLAERGATVGIVARRRDRLEQVLADCQRHAPRSRLWAADLGDLARAQAVVREAWDAFGHLDVLVNNAAIPSRTRVSRLSPEAVEEVMRVNFHSPVQMGMEALRRMLARGSGQIVNVSSLGGRLGIQYEGAYCAAKFALCGWSECMAIDLMDEPVDVKLVIPGPIDTEIWDIETDEKNHYTGPKIPAAECAQGIVAAIEGEGFEHYIPDMKQIVLHKTEHTEAFLRGSAQMAKAHGG